MAKWRYIRGTVIIRRGSKHWLQTKKSIRWSSDNVLMSTYRTVRKIYYCTVYKFRSLLVLLNLREDNYFSGLKINIYFNFEDFSGIWA
jgi:hypothetical protein